MIFVTVGTREDSFDRLIRRVEELAPELDHEINVQIGHTDYEPDGENVEWFRFTDEETIQRLYATADIVVAHAGAGTVLTALANEKPLVLVPRYDRYDEHENDHQLDLAEALEDRPAIFVVYDIDDLEENIASALAATDQAERSSHEEGNDLERFLNSHLSGQS